MTTSTIDELCYMLESLIDRPVVNKTKLAGVFEFSVKASETGYNDFPERLREQTGIVIEPAERPVETLVLKPR